MYVFVYSYFLVCNFIISFHIDDYGLSFLSLLGHELQVLQKGPGTTILYYTILYYTILYYTVLYYTIL